MSVTGMGRNFRFRYRCLEKFGFRLRYRFRGHEIWNSDSDADTGVLKMLGSDSDTDTGQKMTGIPILKVEK